MGSLKCRIVIKKGVINVLNIDGTPSELYQEALLLTGNQDQALKLWQTAYSDDFIAEYGTNNKDQMSLDDVLKYLDTHNASSKNLTKEQRESVVSIMESNGISTLSDLQNKLTKIFKPKGLLEVNTKAAIKSKLYTEDDIRNLNVEDIKDLLDAIEGELVRSDIEIEPKTPTKLVDSSRKNALGGSERVALEQAQESVIDSIDNFQDPKQVKDAIESSPYAEVLPSSFKKSLPNLSRIPVVSIVNGELTTANRSTATTLENTLQSYYSNQDVVKLQADLEQLSRFSPETLKAKPEATVKFLQEIEDSFRSLGIDVIGLSKHPERIDEIKSILEAGIKMIEFGTPADINKFAELKDSLIAPDKSSTVTTLDPKYRNLTIVRLDTQIPLDTLYKDYNLIKVGDNLFHKVSDSNDVADLYEALYDKVINGEIKLNTKVDYKLPENKKEVISKVLPEFVAKQPARGYTTTHEIVVLHQLVFDHNATKPSINKSARLTEIKTDPEYLKDDFITDFYKYILDEKAKDSLVYRETLSAFAITDNDISLHRRIDSIEGIIPQQELEDYIRLKKDTEMDYLLPATTGVRNDILHTLNNLDEVKTYSKPTRMVDGHVVTEANNKDFIKVEGNIYRQSVRNAEASVYTKIEPKPGAYNIIDPTNYYNEKEVADILEKSKDFFTEVKPTTEEQKDIVKELEPKVKAKPKKLAKDKQVTQLVSEYLKERLGSDISILSEEDMRKELNKLGYDSLQAMIVGEKAIGGLGREVLGDLVLAKGLTTIGVSPSAIKRLTGWEYSNDFWKYELPEPKFKLENVEEGKEYKLSDVIEADDLIKMYPDYKETKVIFKNEPTSTFNRDTNTIEISTKDEPYTTFTNGKESLTFVPGESKRMYRLGSSSKRNFAHELSHAQQWQEGFYRGGSPATIGARAIAISGINKADKESVLIEKLQKALDNKNLSQSDRNVVQAVLNAMNNNIALYQAYQNIVGEIEARNIESRINLTPEERRNTTLASTEDNIPEKDRIKFLEANDKVYGFYNPATDKIYLTEEFLNSGTLLHEHWHAFKPALKEKAEAGDKTAKLILDRMSALVDESGAFNEAEFSARYDAGLITKSNLDFSLIGEKGAKQMPSMLQSLQKAKDLKAEGKTDSEIAVLTGWSEYGGHWSYFSKDSIKEFGIAIPNIKAGDIVSLADLIHKNEIFKFYPELKDIQVSFYEGPKNQLGYENNTGIFINILGGTEGIRIGTPEHHRQLESTLIHELNHRLQKIEQRNVGGSESTVVEMARRISNTDSYALGHILDNINKLDISKLSANDRVVIATAKHVIEAKIKGDSSAAYRAYTLLRGDFESRALEYIKNQIFKGEDLGEKTFNDFANELHQIEGSSPIELMNYMGFSDSNSNSLLGINGINNLDKSEGTTQRLEGLQHAIYLSEIGKTPEEIRTLTGWEQNTNGDWRYELDDSGVSIKDNAKFENKYDDFIQDNVKSIKLVDFIGGTDLFKAYPGLKNANVVLYKKDSENKGMFFNNTIYINENQIKDGDKQARENQLLSTLYHELTHYSQHIDGLISGTSEEAIRRQIIHVLSESTARSGRYGSQNDYIQEAVRALRETFQGKSEEEYLSMLKDPLYLDYASTALYIQQVGEVEARNVQKRLRMSPKVRLAKLLSSTQDIPSNKQNNFQFSTALSSEAYNPRPGESKQDYIDRMREEVEANLLGANGEEYFKRIAKENNLTEEATKSFLQKIKDFIGQFSDWLANQLGFGNMTPKEAAKLSTKDLLDRVTTTMLRGDSILDKANKEFKDQNNETDKIVKLQSIGFRFITPVTKKDVENISCT